MWRNGSVLCFDNVETRGSYSQDKLLEVYQKASQELLDVSRENENDVESLKLITYGTSESRMSKPEKMVQMYPLPTMLEKVGYTDTSCQQGILAGEESKDIYFGEVVARYQDPRPSIKEITDIQKLSNKQISKINQELDGIEYTQTGNTRKTNVRNCRYIAYSKDCYITINRDGKVETQILKKDSRAEKEYKEKARQIMQDIKNDIIPVPEDLGGGR